MYNVYALEKVANPPPLVVRISKPVYRPPSSQKKCPFFDFFWGEGVGLYAGCEVNVNCDQLVSG